MFGKIKSHDLREFVGVFRQIIIVWDGIVGWRAVALSRRWRYNGRKAMYVYGMGIDISRYKKTEEKMHWPCVRPKSPTIEIGVCCEYFA
ncbi:MAG: hypothetical protein ACLU4N_09240 [Butyricimonas faecihominis]